MDLAYKQQRTSTFLAFVDLTKAFDAVNWTLLWDVLSKFNCPLNFLQSPVNLMMVWPLTL